MNIHKKISFSVEDYFLDEDASSHFAILNMRVASSGMNLHNLPIKREAILNSAKSLFGKPVLAFYDETKDDFLGHEKEEIPVGVLLDGSPTIEEDDTGKSWLSTKAYIWKKYFPEVLGVFKKKDGKTDVSMEIEVSDSSIESDGYEWINAFSFLGVTLLGVTPAIPGAEATVLQFSEIVEKAKEEFSSRYDDLNFTIPSGVKKAAQSGLDLRKEHGRGGTSVGMATARYLVNNKVATPEKVRHIAKYFPRHAGDNLDDKTSNGWIAWQLWGGNSGRSWSTKLVKQMEELDEKQMAMFSYDDEETKDVSNKNMSEEKDNNKEEELEQDKDKKLNSSSPEAPENFETESKTSEEEKESMAAEEKKEEEKEDEKFEEKEEKENDKSDSSKEKTEDEGEDVKMSDAAYADVPATMSMLGEETEEMREMASLFGSEEKDFAKISSAMYAVLKSTAHKMSRMREEREKEKEEFESLKKFKSESEQKWFSEKVEGVVKEVKEFMAPQDLEAWVEKSKTFSFDTFDNWEKEIKAHLFSVIKDRGKDSDEVTGKIPFPHVNGNEKVNKKYIW